MDEKIQDMVEILRRARERRSISASPNVLMGNIIKSTRLGSFCSILVRMASQDLRVLDPLRSTKFQR